MNLSDVFVMSDEDLPPAYHNGNGHGRKSEDHKQRDKQYQKRRYEANQVDPRDRPMIAWDGEGMKLRGVKRPQNYVLFGCSADRFNPLLVGDAGSSLDFFRIVDYATAIAKANPTAYHIGFFFSYDQNMIVQSLPPMCKLALYEKNRCSLKHDGCIYKCQWTPKKRIRLTKIDREGKRSSLVIDDMAAFFAKSFLKAYGELFPEDLATESFKVIAEGKANRAEMLWADMARVRHYWEHEIVALAKLAERFKEIMYDAGFELREWYGPGALANLIRRLYNLAPHEHGGKQIELSQEVHDASKRGYFGGHVEQYVAGRIGRRVHVYDINSAYPAAIAKLPSLREGGHWHHVERPTRGIRVGIYHTQYGDRSSPIPWRPQPLPHRDHEAEISYPSRVDGWYWTPEAAMAKRSHHAVILGGYEWHPADKDDRPWAFLADMYQQRLTLKDAGNPCERAFKLGPNSLYGKLAQRAGWDSVNMMPPRAHTLPLAGWVTAYCRAEIMKLVARMDPRQVIAVETDGVFSTQSPEQLGIVLDKELGGWGTKEYADLIYVQNGLYIGIKDDGSYEIKTRGMDPESITYDSVIRYLETLQPGERWEPTEITQRERFIGIGSAISRSRTTGGKLNPFKMNQLHCRWELSPRQMSPGLKGKRVHIAKACPACGRGHTPAEAPHQLFVRSRALMHPESFPYRLPWEDNYQKPEWSKMDDSMNDELALEAI